MDDLDKEEHSVFTAVSPSGWSNEAVGLGWLKQVFNRFTKSKARRKHRLLIVDGHGSHLTMDFISYCDQEKIMLAVYPPHSTHTLQPLDVVCFKPLAQNYSNELTDHLHKSQGLVPMKKGDFFRLFWAAWVKTFTEKLIHSAFKSTGLSPWDPNVILSKFAPKSPEPPPVTPPPQPYEGPDWRLADSALQRAVKDKYAEDSVRVRDTLHHLHIQNQLLTMTNKGLEQALRQQKKGNKKSKALPLI